MPIGKGAGSLFIRVFNEQGTVAFDRVSRLTYVHSDSAEDYSSITIETNDLNLPDHPDLQEHKKLIITWGYLQGATRSQKVYIWDVHASFDTNGLRLELICYCKLAYLKMSSRKNVYNGMTLPEMGEQIASEYNMNFEMEGFDDTEDIAAGKLSETPTDPNRKEEPRLFYQNYNQPQQSTLDFKGQKLIQARDATALPMTAYSFKRYDGGFTTGNDSDLKTLEKVAEVEPTTGITIDGHDDDLIIRKRNFSQQAYKVYTFKAESGHLLTFNPGTKTATKGKGGITTTIEGWDEENKEFVNGVVDASHNPQTKLGEVVELPTEEIVRKNIYDQRYNPSFNQMSVQGFFTEEQDGWGERTLGGTEENPVVLQPNPTYKKTLVEKIDTTKTTWAHVVMRGTRQGQLDFQKQKYKVAADVTGRVELNGFVPVTATELIQSTETTKEDIAGQGVNRQAAKQAELYEASADIMGDPDLESAKVITILGVSEKYSGNYYIASVTHELVPESGYICYLRLLKNALNKTKGDSNNKIDINAIGGTKNVTPGIPNDGTSELLKIGLRED